MPMNPLVQQMLAQQLQQSGQANPSKMAPYSQVLATLAAVLADKSQTRKDYNTAKSLAESLATTPGKKQKITIEGVGDAPDETRVFQKREQDVPITIEGFGDIPSETKTYRKRAQEVPVTIQGGPAPDVTKEYETRPVVNQDLVKQLMALSGGNPGVLQQFAMKQMLENSKKQEDYTLALGAQRRGPNNEILAENPKPVDSKKDEKFEIGNVAYPGGDPFAVIRAKGPDGNWGVFRPGANGGPDFSQPLQPGYQWVNTSLSATEPGGLSSKQKDELTGTREGAMNALGLSGMLRKQLEANPKIGLVGFVVQGADTINQQLRQFADVAGVSKQIAGLSIPSKYEDMFAGFGPEAAKSQQFKTGITQLAILNAIAHNNGRAPTDGDVKREIASLAASSGSPAQIIAALDQMDAITRMQANNAYRVRKGEEPPEGWLPPGSASPSGGGKVVTLPDGTRVEMLP